MLYENGYEFSAVNLLGYSKDMYDSTINPLASADGEIVFEIPESVAETTDELLVSFSLAMIRLYFRSDNDFVFLHISFSDTVEELSSSSYNCL